MGKWLPKWLGVSYCILYATYKGKTFTFNEARRELDSSKTKTLKILSELIKRGFLISKREDKGKIYLLSDFDSVSNGVKAKKDFGDLGFEERLKRAYKDYGRRCLVVGSFAAFLYHNYQTPVRREIEIFAEDYGFWSNLLDKAEISVELTDEKFNERVEMEELFVSSPETIIVEALMEGSAASVLDAATVLVSERGLEHLDWNKLRRYAEERDVVAELGVILDILYRSLKDDYGKVPFSYKFIDDLYAHIKEKGRMKVYPKTLLNTEDQTFKDIGKKWRIKLYLPPYIIEKAVNDVAPFGLRMV